MKKLFCIAYWIIIWAAAVYWIYSYTPPKTILLAACMALGCGISIYKSFKTDGYIGQTLALKDNGRTPVYDYLRCLAVLFVIAFHTIGFDLVFAEELTGTSIYNELNYIRWLFFSCNPIFVMISGALLLKYKDEGVLQFYKKRALKIIVPLVVYYVWYYWQAGRLDHSSLIDLFTGIITADVESINANNFWLVYNLIAIYIIIPFFRPMFKDLSYKMLSAFVIIIFAILMFDTYIPTNIELIRPFAGWIFVAIVGFWCSKEETRKYDTWLILIGLLTCIGLWFIIKYDKYYPNRLDDVSPYLLLVSVGLFGLFFKLNKYLKNIYIIRLVSKYSYGIMLIHFYWVWENIKKGYIRISSVMYKGVGALPTLLWVLALSFLTAYAFDNLLITPINSISDKIKTKRTAN